MLGVFVRALLGFEQRRARVLGVRGRAGTVTAIQRCGSALNANPHLHTLVAEGVFEEQPDGAQRFVPLREPPTDVEVARLLAAVRGRIIRLLRRHDIDLHGSSDDERSDPLALDSPVLAQVQGASVLPALRGRRGGESKRGPPALCRGGSDKGPSANHSSLSGLFGRRSARILATSKKLLCTAFVADVGNAPPTSAWQLNIIKLKTQKGD